MNPQTKHKLATAVTAAVRLGGLAALTASLAARAEDLTATEAIEEISVVGTHIKGLDLKGAVQAIQIDRRAIEESGADSLIDLMRDISVTGGGGGTFSTSTAGALSSDTPVGAAGVSLRGLGTSSTLTLINGRRASVSSFARGQESFIDVNSIPLAAIERVEILPGGASATYGADAVAGVVNYVLRDDYEGSEFSINYGNSSAGSDEGRQNINWVWGKNTERTHTMVVVDYFDRNALFDRDRAVSRNSVRPSQQGFYPSFNDLFRMPLDQTEEPQNGGCPTADFGSARLGEFCLVNTNAFVSTVDDYESLGAVGTFNLRLSDKTTWFNELMYQNTESRGTSSPANFSRTPVAPENPNFPASFRADLVAEAGHDDFSDFDGFPIFMWGKYIEPRAVAVDTQTMRLVSGFETEIKGWSFETAVTYGRSESEQRGLSGLVVTENFYNANLGNLCSDGTTVERWTLDLNRPTATFNGGPTCEDLGKTTLWYNPFGGQTTQAEGIDDFIRTTARREGESQLWSFDAIASGDLFPIGGNYAKAAVGIEYRHEEVEDIPAGIAIADTLNPEPILGFSSTSSDAERDQWAAFVELHLPLADNIEVQLAGRFDDYEDFGSDFNPKVAFRYAPVEAVALRGNWSTSFRAPSLAQAGAGTLLGSYTVDCEETPEACGGDNTANGEPLFSEELGNRDLEPEEAESWGFGLLLTPTEDIEVSIDYWNIRHEDLVGIDEDNFIDRALNGEFTVAEVGLLPTGVPGVEVDGDGFVVDAHFQLTNLGWQETDGVDIAYTHYFDATGYGDFTLLFDATYVNEFDRRASDTADIDSRAGAFRYPRWLANAKLRWRLQDWRASLSANYTHSYRDDPPNRILDTLGIPRGTEVTVSSWTLWNMNLSYEFDDHNYLQLNVDNLFDREPPRVLGSSANVDHINHDSLGRFISLRYTYSF
ncbi:TonB-dependent receptor [Exilibacterium tricleocarpae]|uniref:TonB-dependent receptor n=1 Tax=Exilibacterium tricleocarpae TaxID=2591008 RepID=A0A545TVC9_9GAMM|nr:TonB-dependent receptor [Exilibacterium tricleocarpae]TQV81176.1 TonB-dependent receptor [Exilibacterium tricleocarpae]